MSKPRLLDLYCGAGGAAKGYALAGWDVVGVDHRPQKNYPFPFVLADALHTLERLLLGGIGTMIDTEGRHYGLDDFAAIHASPPCQRYSAGTRAWKGAAAGHPDFVPATRALLTETGLPFVIENVAGAPLHFPALVCGLALGLGVKRHRYFESNVFLFGTECPPGHRGDYLSVFGHGAQEKVGGKGWVTVFGGGAPKAADCRRRASAELARLAMGITWMTRNELSQAIPPAYTSWIGRQLRAALDHGAR